MMWSPIPFIKYVAARLVQNPDAVQLRLIEGEHEHIIELEVDEDDIKRIIGKGGCIIRSLQSMLNAVSSTLDDDEDAKRYVLEVLE